MSRERWERERREEEKREEGSCEERDGGGRTVQLVG
jgi:hypothetical protein